VRLTGRKITQARVAFVGTAGSTWIAAANKIAVVIRGAQILIAEALKVEGGRASIATWIASALRGASNVVRANYRVALVRTAGRTGIASAKEIAGGVRRAQRLIAEQIEVGVKRRFIRCTSVPARVSAAFSIANGVFRAESRRASVRTSRRARVAGVAAKFAAPVIRGTQVRITELLFS
jgi:hypothetical protein